MIFLMAVLLVPSAWANSGGEGGAGAAQAMEFTVNLGPDHFLKVDLVLEANSPEAAQKVQVFRPRIQHEIILLLSGCEETKLRTLPGKKELADSIVEAANRVIHGDSRDGVKEALFTTFIIQ